MNLASIFNTRTTAPLPIPVLSLLILMAAFIMVAVATSGTPEIHAASTQELADISKQLDQAITALRSGRQPTAAEQARNQDAFMRLESILFRKHDVRDNAVLPEPDRTDYYLNAIKMSLLDPKRHGGWAFRSPLSQAVRLELLHRLDRRYDPFLAFSALFPALKRGETEYAVGAYEALAASDPFLAGKVLEWSAEYQDGELDWLGMHYLRMGQTNKVQQVIADARRIGTELALMSAGAFLERMGDYSEAETVLSQVRNDDFRNNLLSTLYSRNPREAGADGISFRQRLDAMQKRLFTSGLQPVALADCTAPPRSGVTFDDDRAVLHSIGMKAGDVIVAVDGYRVENRQQYNYVRNLDPDNARMILIVWDGKRYTEIDAWIENRRFGLKMRDHEPLQ
ncbi:MAG: hypothetical protein GX174_08870 [Lentisphaerae bacterium]|jgi:hypothetical protein|nr:hypothetical protein [Lentisphaerota bacterium]